MANWVFVFFFFEFLCCSHIDDHPLKELTKFGFMLETKVVKFHNPALFGNLLEPIE
jgi:hypothetical protein